MAACRNPGVSLAAIALDNGLNANLLRRWVVAEEQAQGAKVAAPVIASPGPARVENRAFIPIQVESSAVTPTREITIELRRGATLVKVGWPLVAAGDCAAWLREVLR